MDKKIKLTIPLLAILRSVKASTEGINKNSLMLRSGLGRVSIIQVLNGLKQKNIIKTIGSGKGTKFIKGSEFDSNMMD
jgi:hypothetical protein